MNWLEVLSLLIAGALAVFLGYALLRGERF